MSDPKTAPGPEAAQRADELSALFAQLVLQQSNLAMVLLGKVAHPQTGEVTRDIEAARHFIDTLEMLEAKTQGNLSKEESGLLKQSLMSLRLAFVEAVETPASASAAPAQKASIPSAPPPPEEEHKKKFTKKY